MMDAMWAARSGLLANQRALSLTGNNLANLATPGYKRTRSLFAANLVQNMGKGAGPLVAGLPQVLRGTGVSVLGQTRFAQGQFQTTNNPLNAMIVGPGFFALQTSQGVSYSRNGAFLLDAQDRLVNGQGQFVLGQNGKPIIVSGTQPVTIGTNGSVNQGNRVVGQLAVYQFANPNGLLATSGGGYIPSANSGPAKAVTPSLRVGGLESANVHIAKSMTNLVKSQNAYAVNAEMLSVANGMDKLAEHILP